MPAGSNDNSSKNFTLTHVKSLSMLLGNKSSEDRKKGESKRGMLFGMKRAESSGPTRDRAAAIDEGGDLKISMEEFLDLSQAMSPAQQKMGSVLSPLNAVSSPSSAPSSAFFASSPVSSSSGVTEKDRGLVVMRGVG